MHRLIVRHENGKRVLACENPRCELAADPKNKYRYTGMKATKRVLRRRSLGWSNGEWRIEKKESQLIHRNILLEVPSFSAFSGLRVPSLEEGLQELSRDPA